MIAVEIIEVKSRKQVREFINFPHELYKGDHNYVPSLNVSIKWMLSLKNPFLEHSKIALFIALINGKMVGRIAAIYNKTHLDTYNDGTGFFGFMDMVNDITVTKALLSKAECWLKQQGINRIIGPANLTTNDTCGFLTKGFELQPMVEMPYNFAYYNNLCEQCGYSTAVELNSYSINGEAILVKYKNIYQKGLQLMQSKSITIRNISQGSFANDIDQLKGVYNLVNQGNWGFMPLNKAEFNAMANTLRTATPLDLTLLVEINNKIIGFLIALPNLNQALVHVRNGRLLPVGFIKFLWYRRKINSARILILGLMPEYQKTGIDIVLYQRIKEALNVRKIYNSDACYVLDNNRQMNSILSKISEGIVKKHRMYVKDIS